MVRYMSKAIRALKRDENGAALVEYALLVGLIAVVAVVALQGVSTKLNAAYKVTENKLALIK
jgi:pilus assembly protein Flp/PilA